MKTKILRFPNQTTLIWQVMMDMIDVKMADLDMIIRLAINMVEMDMIMLIVDMVIWTWSSDW